MLRRLIDLLRKKPKNETFGEMVRRLVSKQAKTESYDEMIRRILSETWDEMQANPEISKNTKFHVGKDD